MKLVSSNELPESVTNKYELYDETYNDLDFLVLLLSKGVILSIDVTNISFYEDSLIDFLLN